MDIENHPTFEAMRAAERAAIKAEEPEHNIVHLVPTLTPERAREMAALKAGTGVAATWKALEGTPLYEQMRKHWMDPAWTAEEAMRNVPDGAGSLEGASRSTWERVFGPRTMRASRRRT